MTILPVLDLLHGCVVRGVAGRRDDYKPIVSRLVDSAQPLDVARAIRGRFGLDRLYVADLDAIESRGGHAAILRELADDGFHLLVDAGIRDERGVRQCLDNGADAAVVGLETLPSAGDLEQLLQVCEPRAIVFSLDLRDGLPLGCPDGWASRKPLDIARQAFEAGLARMIVLDLAGIGVGAGVPTLDLCRQIRAACPGLWLATGGGVRNGGDLRAVAAGGVDAVLVASALHDGTLAPHEIDGAIDSDRANRRVATGSAKCR